MFKQFQNTPFIAFYFLLLLYAFFLPSLSLVVSNCTDGTPANLPCDQDRKVCDGDPSMGCEMHGPIYFCCGKIGSPVPSATQNSYLPTGLEAEQNCDDKFKQCDIWAKRGICFLSLYTPQTKAKLCPKTCKLCHLVAIRDEAGRSQVMPKFNESDAEASNTSSTSTIPSTSSASPQIHLVETHNNRSSNATHANGKLNIQRDEAHRIEFESDSSSGRNDDNTVNTEKQNLTEGKLLENNASVKSDGNASSVNLPQISPVKTVDDKPQQDQTSNDTIAIPSSINKSEAVNDTIKGKSSNVSDDNIIPPIVPGTAKTNANDITTHGNSSDNQDTQNDSYSNPSSNDTMPPLNMSNASGQNVSKTTTLNNVSSTNSSSIQERTNAEVDFDKQKFDENDVLHDEAGNEEYETDQNADSSITTTSSATTTNSTNSVKLGRKKGLKPEEGELVHERKRNGTNRTKISTKRKTEATSDLLGQDAGNEGMNMPKKGKNQMKHEEKNPHSAVSKNGRNRKKTIEEYEDGDDQQSDDDYQDYYDDEGDYDDKEDDYWEQYKRERSNYWKQFKQDINRVKESVKQRTRKLNRRR